jgi:hypothetical protein
MRVSDDVQAEVSDDVCIIEFKSFTGIVRTNADSRMMLPRRSRGLLNQAMRLVLICCIFVDPLVPDVLSRQLVDLASNAGSDTSCGRLLRFFQNSDLLPSLGCRRHLWHSAFADACGR